ncbi:ZIP family metal transporter [Pendulispora albinea]|uniref:ZIP family metal transporter n=1 Tax=Pendulispora albinea TaxID=2741071 RepID=A0ABZ2M3F7_9BACT
MPTLEQLIFALFPAALLVVSGAVATLRPPTAWMRSAILHLAAGVVFAVVAVELIPDLLRDHRPIETAIGFAIGVAAMLGLRAFSHANEKHERPEPPADPTKEPQSRPPNTVEPIALPIGMLAGIAIDLVIDGFMIGIGFAAGSKEGRMLAVALAIELVSLGLAVAAGMSKLGIARARSLVVLIGLSATFLAGAAIGMVLLSQLSNAWLAGVLSFGAAALLFLVTEELLTEAHEEEETLALTAMFFAGFLAFLILGMLGS